MARNRKRLDAYKRMHPICEACGAPAFGDPHHIKTVGAGGGDDDENLLRLCGRCHRLIHTSEGKVVVALMSPVVFQKLVDAGVYVDISAQTFRY